MFYPLSPQVATHQGVLALGLRDPRDLPAPLGNQVEGTGRRPLQARGAGGGTSGSLGARCHQPQAHRQRPELLLLLGTNTKQVVITMSF